MNQAIYAWSYLTKRYLAFSFRHLLEKLIKQYKLGRIRQVEFVKKRLITDGANKNESLLNTDNMSSSRLSF